MLINAKKSTFLFNTFKIYLGNPSKTEKYPNKNACGMRTLDGLRTERRE